MLLAIQNAPLRALRQDTAQWGTEDGINLVAFGGGVASTLAAFLVHSVFEARSVAVFGVGRRTTDGQLQRARTLAECLGASRIFLPASPLAAASCVVLTSWRQGRLVVAARVPHSFCQQDPLWLLHTRYRLVVDRQRSIISLPIGRRVHASVPEPRGTKART